MQCNGCFCPEALEALSALDETKGLASGVFSQKTSCKHRSVRRSLGCCAEARFRARVLRCTCTRRGDAAQTWKGLKFRKFRAVETALLGISFLRSSLFQTPLILVDSSGKELLS